MGTSLATVGERTPSMALNRPTHIAERVGVPYSSVKLNLAHLQQFILDSVRELFSTWR